MKTCFKIVSVGFICVICLKLCHIMCLLLSTLGDGDSNVYGAFGAKIGSGAAKVGKKAAQSEAGRSAGKAAAKGATDAAQKDLTDRYLRQGQYGAGEPPPAPASTPKEVPKPSKESHKPSSSKSSNQAQSSEPSPFAGSETKSIQSYSEQRQKPSFFSKYKPVIHTHSKSSKPPPRPRQNRGERIYKHRLAKEADWDRLPLAQALYHFKGEMKCDLEFRKGQVIQVMTRTDKQFDWWEGKLDDRVGIFPANYVKLL